MLVPRPATNHVPGVLQFRQGGPNRVPSFLAEGDQTLHGIHPVLGQGQHHRQQPLGLEAQVPVLQVMV